MAKEYFAFISYKSEDVEWAVWLQHELEHYHLPASYNGRDDVRKDLRPVFRDIDELSAGNLPEQIHNALVNSQYLIVICSPKAAKSPWVNQEVETFISLGRTDCIFPFIVEGNSPGEFFPSALLNLPKNQERLGGDVSKNGRDAAFVKIVAGMLHIDFDSLWNRYEKEKAEQERIEREKRDYLFQVQSHFLSEKAENLLDEGNIATATLLALESLPKNIEDPERPYLPEAEAVLRKSLSPIEINLKLPFESKLVTYCESTKKLAILDSSADIYIKNVYDNNIVYLGYSKPSYMTFSHDGKFLSLVLDSHIELWQWQKRVNMKHSQEPIDYKITVLYPDCRYAYFTPNDAFLLVVTKNNELALLNPWTDVVEILWQIPIISDKVLIRFNSNGKYIYLFEGDEQLKILSSQNGCLLKAIHISSLDMVDFFINDNFQLTAIYRNGKVSVYDLNQVKEIYNYRMDNIFIEKGQLVSNGSYFFDYTHSTLIPVRQIKSNDILISFPMKNISDIDYNRMGAYFSLDGHLVSAICIDNIEKNTFEDIIHTLKVWDSSNGNLLVTKEIGSSQIRAITFAPNERIIAIADIYDIKICDVKNNKFIGTIKTYNEAIVKHLTITDDSALLVAYIEDRDNDMLQVCNIRTGQTIQLIQTKEDIENAFLNLPHIDSVLQKIDKGDKLRYVLFNSANKNGCIFDFMKYDYFNQIRAFTNIQHIFSPDTSIYGIIIKTKIQVFSINDGLITTIEDTEEISDVAFSFDNKLLISASVNGTIRIWDISSSIILKSYHIYKHIRNIKISKDSKHIYAFCKDSTVKVFSYPSLADIIQFARSKYQHYKLSPDEQKKYFLL